MGVISEDKNVIKIFYNSKSRVGRQTLSYLEGSYKDILAIDTEETEVTGTQFADISDNLNCEVSDLIDKEHPSFTEQYDTDLDLSDTDWIKILQSRPEVLSYPIVIIGHQYLRVNNPSEIESKLAPNSKGLDEQHPDSLND